MKRRFLCWQSWSAWSRLPGQAFNSLLGRAQGGSAVGTRIYYPRNPFYLCRCDCVARTLFSEPFIQPAGPAFHQFIRNLAQNESIIADEVVWESERAHGNRNAAMAYLMKSFGNIQEDVQDVLDHYFYQCAVSMSCVDLARSLAFLANRGVHPCNQQRVCDFRSVHRVNALLSTSGMYDQSGEFAFTVGLPAKSGVGGGLVAIVPDYGVICAFSPKLNPYGNPHKGMYMITQFAERLGLSVFS